MQEDNVVFKHYKKPNSVVRAACVAVENHLYQFKTWDMYAQLTETISLFKDFNFFNGSQIVLAFEGTIPFAISYMDNTGSIMVFVKKEYRRKGYGSKLIAKFKSKKELNAGLGIKGSQTFWDKNKITIIEYEP